MSVRIGFLRRTSSGGLIVGARCVGEHTAESWEASIADAMDAQDGIEQARKAAAWLAERVKSSEHARLGTLVADVEGASCSWLTVPTGEARVALAALEQHDRSPLNEHGLVPAGVTGTGSSVQALHTGSATATMPRAAVMCMPDAIVRVMLDELDALGCVPDATISFWHAIARAWDPGAQAEANASERIVATSEQITGIVFVDPAGSLAWSWSRAGRLLACGRLRLGEGAENVAVREYDVHRLTSDWLAWSIQQGCAPTRIVCVSPELDESGLTPAGVGGALGEAWPGASVDMALFGDPIGETLSRMATQSTPLTRADTAIMPLTRRPGRAHRRLHLVAALAVVLCGAAILIHAAGQWRLAGRAGDQAEIAREEMVAHVREVIPDAGNMFLMRQVDAELASLATPAPTDEFRAALPILTELENIAFALSTMNVEWDGLKMLGELNGVMFNAYFPEGDVESADLLKQQLSAMPGTTLLPWDASLQDTRGDQLEYRFSTKWNLAELAEGR